MNPVLTRKNGLSPSQNKNPLKEAKQNLKKMKHDSQHKTIRTHGNNSH